jgi:hypothetical protein
MTLVTRRLPSRSRPVEELELDEEGQSDDVTLQPLDELDRALDGAAGRQQVVDDEDLLAGLDRIAVDLEGVRAVLEAYSTVIVSAGSLPSLRTGTSPASSWYAIGALKMNPRDSIPTTMSIRSLANGSSIRSMASLYAAGSFRSVVMS